MRGASVLLLVAMSVTASDASVRGYAVEPVKALWSGKVRGDATHPVAQTVTCCWDSLEAVHLFCGARGDTNSYRLDVKDDSTGGPELA